MKEIVITNLNKGQRCDKFVRKYLNEAPTNKPQNNSGNKNAGANTSTAFNDEYLNKNKQNRPASVGAQIAKTAGSRQDAILQMIDKSSKDYASIAYLDDSDIEDKLFENQTLLKQPIVRNGKTAATVGLEPKTWESWK